MEESIIIIEKSDCSALPVKINRKFCDCAGFTCTITKFPDFSMIG
jgi:hypothetical protein